MVFPVAQQFRAEAAQHAGDQCRALFHCLQRFQLRLADRLPRSVGRLQHATHPRDGGPIDQGQEELVAHHPALAELGLVGPRQVAREPGGLGVLEPVDDDAPDPMRPDRPLPISQVAQQPAQGFVPLGDQPRIRAFERYASQPPHAQVVAAARDHVVRADQRRERHKRRQRVLRPCLRPVARRLSCPGPEEDAFLRTGRPSRWSVQACQASRAPRYKVGA